jgi:hypothetical protein
MVKLLGPLWVCIVSICLPLRAKGYDLSKEAPYVQIERLTVRIEAKDITGNYVSQGSGFFVGDEKGNLFIVTARHVVFGLGDMRARVPAQVTATGKTEMIYLKLPSTLWTFGDDNDKTLRPVDVAVMKLGGIKDHQIVDFSYCPTKCDVGAYNEVGDDPHPLDQVTVLGFPYDLWFTLKEQRPMVRMGVVSFASDEPFIKVDQDPRYMRAGVFIIDCHIFKGNSGGPVLVTNPLQAVRLGGLISATNTDLDYGIVTPVSAIRRMLDKAADAPINMNAWFGSDPEAGQPAK